PRTRESDPAATLRSCRTSRSGTPRRAASRALRAAAPCSRTRRRRDRPRREGTGSPSSLRSDRRCVEGSWTRTYRRAEGTGQKAQGILRLVKRVTLAWFLCALAFGPHLAAFQTGRRATAAKLSKQVTCASDLGAGVKSNRSFCDVIVATRPEKSVSMTIPP